MPKKVAPKKAKAKKVTAKKVTTKRVANKKVVIVPVMVHKKNMKGGAWYDDLADGFKAGASLGLSFL